MFPEFAQPLKHGMHLDSKRSGFDPSVHIVHITTGSSFSTWDDACLQLIKVLTVQAKTMAPMGLLVDAFLDNGCAHPQALLYHIPTYVFMYSFAMHRKHWHQGYGMMEICCLTLLCHFYKVRVAQASITHRIKQDPHKHRGMGQKRSTQNIRLAREPR